MSDSSPTTRTLADTTAAAAATGLFHLVGVGVVTAALSLLLMGLQRVLMVLDVLTVSVFVSNAGAALLVHVGVSACIWAVLFGIWRQLRRRRNNRHRRIVHTGRGTVIVETLIVLPVMLMLILGLAQLAINTSAGVLSHLAAYQTARTVWLWEPETARFDNVDVEEKARLQAAAVMTPVAFSYAMSASDADSERFEQLRGAFVGAQLNEPNNAGQRGINEAADVISRGENLYGDSGRGGGLVERLDGTDYPARSALKFSGAYATTEVQISHDDDEIVATMRYHHYQAMPLVGRLFADYSDEDGVLDSTREGHYALYEREYSLREQPTPHPVIPGQL